MSLRVPLLIVLLVAAVANLGCAGAERLQLELRTGGNAALFGQFQAYDGETGRPLTFAEVAKRSTTADVVFFGEEHSDAVCNALEAQVLYELLYGGRPVTLAMEFLEADTQAAVDAYLRGRIDESEYREEARQRSAYVRSHRPLIEMCRAARVPVLASNAPHTLVSAYRKSGQDFSTFRATTPPEDQRWLPRESTYLGGAYAERFAAMMSEHSAGGGPAVLPSPTTQPATPQSPNAGAMQHATSMPTSQPASQPADQNPPAMASGATAEHGGGFDVQSFYRAQLLWDDAMSESIADYRELHPTRRVMLVVGVFHVAENGGTVQKFRVRRPEDGVCTIVYRSTTDPALPFDGEDRGAGDVVIYGLKAPESHPPMMMPSEPPSSDAGGAAQHPTTTSTDTHAKSRWWP